MKALRNTSEKSAAEALLPKVTSMLDKLAKHNIIHKNKAGNEKARSNCTSTRSKPDRAGYAAEKQESFRGNGSRCFIGGRVLAFGMSVALQYVWGVPGRSEQAGRAEISCLNELIGKSRSNVPCRPGFGLAKPHNPA